MIIQFYKYSFTKQYDQIQSAYFGHKSYSIFTACCYFIDQDGKAQYTQSQSSVKIVITEESLQWHALIL